MKTNNNNLPKLSPFKVTWIELCPENGLVTKHDRRIFGDFSLLGKQAAYYKHFASKESALDWIKGFSKRLDKRYIVRLFTDYQFGKSRTRNSNYYSLDVPFTTKQRETCYNIG